MRPWEITICKGDNGYRICRKDELDDGTVVDKEEYIEEHDGEGYEQKAAQRMLWVVLGHFGIYWSKHRKYNVNIQLNHGSNIECKDKKCDVCHS